MALTLGSCRVSLGVAGWSYPDWEGVVYPGGGADKLRQVARLVDLLEINASFYRLLPPTTVESFLTRVDDLPGFGFAVKANRVFTHEPPGAFGPTEARAFSAGLEPLRQEGRLAAVLFQFPFWFRESGAARERLSRLADFFRDFPRVVEVRHRTWGAPEVLEFLRETGWSVANLDMPVGAEGFGELEVATGEPGYLRLHGRNVREWFTPGATRDARYDYLYDDEELEELTDRVQVLARRFRELIVVANNHYRGQALANVAELGVRLGSEPRPFPESLLRAYPRLLAAAVPLPAAEAELGLATASAAPPGGRAAGRHPSHSSHRRRTRSDPREAAPSAQRDLFE